MIDLIKKAVLTGMGVASLTKEKIDEFSRELIDKGCPFGKPAMTPKN